MLSLTQASDTNNITESQYGEAGNPVFSPISSGIILAFPTPNGVLGINLAMVDAHDNWFSPGDVAEIQRVLGLYEVILSGALIFGQVDMWKNNAQVSAGFAALSQALGSPNETNLGGGHYGASLNGPHAVWFVAPN